MWPRTVLLLTVLVLTSLLCWPWKAAEGAFYSVFQPQNATHDTTLSGGQILTSVQAGVARLAVDEENNLLLLQTGKHRLYKSLANTGYDSTFSIGGNALGREGMNFPSEISAPSRQTTYVLDRNNRRILLFNTNLRIIRNLEFLEIEIRVPGEPPVFLNPSAFAAMPTGELFVLNQDDNRIYKFDRNGRFELMFGGADFGEGSLLSPTDVRVSEEMLVFVPEPERRRVAVYDLFGTFRNAVAAPEGLDWERVAISGDFLGFIGADRLVLVNLKTSGRQTVRFVEAPSLTDAALRPDGLYILSQNRVILYKLK